MTQMSTEGKTTRSCREMIMRGLCGVITGFAALVYGVNPLLVVAGVGFYEGLVISIYMLAEE